MNPGYPTSISHARSSTTLPMPCCRWAANLTQGRAHRPWDPTSVSCHIIPRLTVGAERHSGRKAKPGLYNSLPSHGTFAHPFSGHFPESGDSLSLSRRHHSKLSCNRCSASGCAFALGRSQVRAGIGIFFFCSL